MKNKKINWFIALIVFVLAINICLIGTVIIKALPKSYNKDWILGKTADEIMERYGDFDRTTTLEHGIYKGAYLTKAEGRLPLGDVDPAEYYVIYFNSDGYACAVEKNYVYTRDYIALDIPNR